MKAIRQTNSKGNEIHNGRYAPETTQDIADVRTKEAYEDRLDELRLKAQFQLSRMDFGAQAADITQIGKIGFHYKRFGEVIPDFEPWNRATQIENERIFNART